ncbi:MAG: HAMP domain-containing histidine kinase [Rhodospirillaceae bacterium]|nr:HAMP domain-containing histidine kinase [Rhodospirillaceae bacterium]
MAPGPRPASLVRRMLATSLVLLAVLGPALWFGIRMVMQEAAEEAVDTQLRAFGLQVRAAMVSAGIGAPQPADPIDRQALAFGNVEWVWQVDIGGAPVQRSQLLRISGTTIAAGVDAPTGDFVVRTADTPLGPMRLAERQVVEWPQAAAAPVGPVHYLVGIPLASYQDMVGDYIRHLGRLTLLVVAPSLAALVLVFAVLLLALRRSLKSVERSLDRFQSGETDRVTGRFPRELQDLVDRVNDLLGRNARLLARTRRYVSKIAHDLNHPLAVLQNGLPAGTAGQALRRQVDRMAGLIDRYAQLAQAMGADTAPAGRLALRPVLDDVRAGFQLLYRQTPVVITVDCPQDLAFRIPRQDLEAAVGNLVANAHRFAAGRIAIAARVSGGSLAVTVDDDGPGIPEDRRPQALRWGERLDDSPPGAGIGLAIVADLAALHGGTLTLDRSPLGGLHAALAIPAPGARPAADGSAQD